MKNILLFIYSIRAIFTNSRTAFSGGDCEHNEGNCITEAIVMTMMQMGGKASATDLQDQIGISKERLADILEGMTHTDPPMLKVVTNDANPYMLKYSHCPFESSCG